MIFYDKATGRIVGTVNGRIHSPEEMKMWVGDKEKTDRIVCQWVQVEKDNKKVYVPEIEPKLFEQLEKERIVSREYKVDIKTKKIKKKTSGEKKQEKADKMAARKAAPHKKDRFTILEEKVDSLIDKMSKMEKGIK